MVFVNGIIRHHRCRGFYGGNVSIPAMKWSLNVLMAFSASFLSFIFGGMSWS